MNKLSEIVRAIFKTEKLTSEEEKSKNIQDFYLNVANMIRTAITKGISELMSLYPNNMKEEDIEDDRNEITRVVSKVFRDTK